MLALSMLFLSNPTVSLLHRVSHTFMPFWYNLAGIHVEDEHLQQGSLTQQRLPMWLSRGRLHPGLLVVGNHDTFPFNVHADGHKRILPPNT